VLAAEKRKLSLSLLAPLKDEELRHGLSLLLQSLYALYPNEKIIVSEIDKVPVTACQEFSILKKLGFEEGYNEAILWPSQRR
jgi:hypothetical protein